MSSGEQRSGGASDGVLNTRAWRRLLLAAVVSVAALAAAWLIFPGSSRWVMRAVIAWDAGALTLLAVVWRRILRATPESTHRLAAAEDPGRAVVGAIVLAASAVSLVASAFVIEGAKRLVPSAPGVAVALAVVAVVSAWFLTHTTYTLRYAHLYYSDNDSEAGPDGGLDFPGDREPSDMDFAYFSFVLGMTFQVSDVDISSPPIRNVALWHSLISFWFNVAILALTLNVLGSLL